MRQFGHLVLLILLSLIGLSIGMLNNGIFPASDVMATIKSGQQQSSITALSVGDLNLSGLKIEQPVHKY